MKWENIWIPGKMEKNWWLCLLYRQHRCAGKPQTTAEWSQNENRKRKVWSKLKAVVVVLLPKTLRTKTKMRTKVLETLSTSAKWEQNFRELFYWTNVSRGILNDNNAFKGRSVLQVLQVLVFLNIFFHTGCLDSMTTIVVSLYGCPNFCLYMHIDVWTFNN